jgi:hypothetical protein
MIKDASKHQPSGEAALCTVIPTDLDRFKKIRELLRRKFNLSLTQGNDIVAALFGFKWYRDVADAYYKDTTMFDYVFEPEDEELDQMQLMIRIMSQTSVIEERTGASFAEAYDFVLKVRPTSRDHAPSLSK